jgi:hypothetical protein
METQYILALVGKCNKVFFFFFLFFFFALGVFQLNTCKAWRTILMVGYGSLWVLMGKSFEVKKLKALLPFAFSLSLSLFQKGNV